jgi:hypothetical protein
MVERLINPADIKAAVVMGDKLVEDSWPELQQFLGV